MRRLGLVLACCTAVFAGDANAEKDLYERLWPRGPDSQRASFSEQITDQLTELGNTLGYHTALLSHDMIAMRFDGRRRRAHVAIGGGDEHFLTFRLASDVQFIEGLARVNTRIDLSFRGRKIELRLPETEVVPASYRDERGVEVRLPIFRRKF